jgi:hypothetical protein
MHCLGGPGAQASHLAVGDQRAMLESAALEKWRQQASVIALGGLGAARVRRVVCRHRPAVSPPDEQNAKLAETAEPCASSSHS